MNTYINDGELRTATHKRDGEPVGQFEVRFTDPKAFVEDLKADYRIGAVEDRIVRIAVINGHADQGQVDVAFGDHRGSAGGNRTNPWYQSKFVEASYQARGQLIKLSCYCGIATADDIPEAARECGRAITEATAKAIQSATRTVQAVLHQLEEVEVRGGGFYVQDGPWTAWPGSPIDATDELTCATCSVGIYWSNGAWRAETTRKAEVWLDDGEDHHGRPKKKLDHVHDPEEAGRTL